jgi:chemotaxis response regulator CheB
MSAKGRRLKAVRVLLLGMPTMLRQVLSRVIAEAPGLEVVGEMPNDGLCSPNLLAAEPDFLIIGADEASDEDVAALLQRNCRIRVLRLSSDGREGTLHEMWRRRTLLGELSATHVVEVAQADRMAAPESQSRGQ